ncbi:MAG: hypothetical protein WC755_02105 [Candidatus Woesearchaeota archaeon]|jgi:hypothetical protein
MLIETEKTVGGFEEKEIKVSFNKGIVLSCECDGVDIVCHFLKDEDKISFGAPCKIPWLNLETEKLIIEKKVRNNEGVIQFLDISFEAPNRIDIHEGYILQNPEQSYSVGIHIPRVLHFMQKEAEILTPDNNHLIINKDT